MSTSAYYEWAGPNWSDRQPAELDEAHLVNEMIDIHRDPRGTYGSSEGPPQHSAVRRYRVNDKRAERLMGTYGIVGLVELPSSSPRTTTASPRAPHLLPDLIGQRLPTRRTGSQNGAATSRMSRRVRARSSSLGPSPWEAAVLSAGPWMPPCRPGSSPGALGCALSTCVAETWPASFSIRDRGQSISLGREFRELCDRLQHPPVGRPGGYVLRQQCRGIVLVDAEARARSPIPVRHTRRGHRRHHRLDPPLQQRAPSLHPRLRAAG